MEKEIDMSYKRLQVKYCPKCHKTSIVENSRTEDCGVIRRRRMCPECRAVWNTVEVLEDE